MEPVHRLPYDLVGLVADDGADARVEGTRRLLRIDVVVPGDLPVDAEGRARAGMDEHLPAGIPGGVEVEPALVGPAGELGPDVADEEPVVEGVPIETGSEQLTDV